MLRVFSFILIVCHISNCAEIDIPAYAKALEKELSESAITDRVIANNFKNWNESNLEEEFNAMQMNNLAIANGFYKLHSELSAVVHTLDEYKNTNISGDVYFPDELFNQIRNGAVMLGEGFTNAANIIKTQSAQYEKYWKYFQVNSEGYITLPSNDIGKNLIDLNIHLRMVFSNLANTSLTTQIALKKATELLTKAKNQAGVQLFKVAIIVFQQGIDDFSKIAKYILDLVDNLKALGLETSQSSITISGSKFYRMYKSAMLNIGNEYSIIANQAKAF